MASAGFDPVALERGTTVLGEQSSSSHAKKVGTFQGVHMFCVFGGGIHGKIMEMALCCFCWVFKIEIEFFSFSFLVGFLIGVFLRSW